MSKLRIVGVSGGPSKPSRTRALVEAITTELAKGLNAEIDIIDLAEVAPLISGAVWRTGLGSEGEAVIRRIETADLLVAGSPVYRASFTGLFKHLFDLVDQHALAGRPVILAATGGSERHALVIEHQLRPLFSFFAAQTVPFGVYGSEADFENYRIVNPALAERVAAAAAQARGLLSLRPADAAA